MKKVISIFILTALFFACKQEKSVPKSNEEELKKEAIFEMMENAIIYEANIRQYSKEGTFEQFTKDIPQLKQLGVKIIWLMPVFPISETKRKATGDKFASDFPEEERKKYLGSYYAVSDFKKINPEFGTIEDFRKLIKTAHDNDMYVILDWVPNHTGWDHIWIKTNPEFYTKNAKGEITDPLNEDGIPVGWADVADLNYDNNTLRTTMISDMKHWIVNENIDGFRCDVAGSVPTDFWQQAIPELRKEKNIFMLAEAWEPELLKGELFDMAYGWDTHHKMNHIAQAKEDVSAWDKRIQQIDTLYEKDDILMNFVTNHDENSWNGTIEERMGKAAPAFTALSYVAPGMPLIYSGQEYNMNHRLKFFEKDEIPKEKADAWALLQKLGALKSTHLALHGGKNAASYTKIETNKSKEVLVFKREKHGETIYFMANFSNEPIVFNAKINGDFTDYMAENEVHFPKLHDFTFEPWEYKILITK